MFDSSEVTNIEHLSLSVKHIYTKYYVHTDRYTDTTHKPLFKVKLLSKGFWHLQLQKKHMQLYHVGLLNTTCFFSFSQLREKSIGRIMMLLSVLLPRLYIPCHQFTTQPLDLNLSFYSSALCMSYLFVTAACVWARQHACEICAICASVCVCVCMCMRGRSTEIVMTWGRSY